MSFFDPRRFGAILRVPGAAGFTSAGFLARIPLSGMTLAITLAVVDDGRSYTDAGLLVGVFATSRALSAPLLSRLVDRFGQFAVMLLATASQLCLLAVLTAGIAGQWHLGVLTAVAGIAGFGTGSPPAFVRARWSALLKTPTDLSTAFSWESLVESLGFTIAPLIIVGLASWFSPVVSMSFVVAMVGIAGFALYLQRGTQPVVIRNSDGTRQHIDRRTAAIVFTSAAYYFSASFAMGALDIISVSQGEIVSIPGFTGIVLAVCSVGKMIGAIGYGSVTWRISPRQRMLGIVPVFAALAFLVPLTSGTPWLLVAALLIGPLYSAALTSSNLIVQAVVPKGRLTEQLAWMFAAFGLGVAAGNYFAGFAVDLSGPAGAAWVFVASGVMLLLTLAADLLLLRRGGGGRLAA